MIIGLRELQLPQTRASTQTGLVEADTHQESTSLRLYHQGDAMIELILWTMLFLTEPRQIPGPYLIPGNVKTPPRILRCVECGTWPVRVRN